MVAAIADIKSFQPDSVTKSLSALRGSPGSGCFCEAAMRICPKCKKEPSRKQDRSSYCLSCHRAYMREHIKKPEIKEKRNAYLRHRYATNPKARAFIKAKQDRRKDKTNAWQKEYRKREDVKVRIKAGRIFHNAIRSGKMERLPCVVCGNPKSEGHHEDYSEPLDVIWLCRKHHKDIHRKLRN